MLIKSIFILNLLLFSTTILAKSHKNQIECLATAIYYESRGEPDLGKKSVGHVIMNRVKSGKYPDDVCSVIYQQKQFSFFKKGKKLLTPPKTEVYNEIYDMAKHIYHNHERLNDPTNNALFFHATYVNPKWKKRAKIKIGKHIFY